MTDRTEQLLGELLQVQREVLANQEAALEGQRAAIAAQSTALAMQRRALRTVFALIGLVVVAALLPYFWRWFVFLSAR